MSVRVVFMGSPLFAIPSLNALLDRYDIVGVVTQPDRKAGRGRALAAPPIKELAVERGLEVIQPPKVRAAEAMAQLCEWAPDVIVVTAFGQILKQDLLDLPPHGCVNVHASLLPRWRGASPIAQAIFHGDARTGVTIMKMDAGMDTGPIISQGAVPILPDDTTASLSLQLSDLGARLLVETLPGYLSGQLEPEPQREDGATFAPLLKKAQGRLDFSRTAAALERQVRAFTPWPGSFFEVDGGRFKVHQAGTAPGSLAPGELGIEDGLPAVGTAEGSLVLEVVQPVGKRPMPGDAYLNGLRDKRIWGAD